MDILEALKMQPKIKKIIDNSFTNNKLSHAYIFEADSGVGSKEIAKYFAMKLLCKNEHKPCFKCMDCQQIILNSHIDLTIIEPIGDVIKKEQITSLIKDFSNSSLKSDNQIYIINEANKMNLQAANALLKFLEEPSEGKYALLLVNNHQLLLDTIVSRTMVLHFSSMSKSAVVDDLMAHGFKKDISFVLSTITKDKEEAASFIAESKIIEYYTLAVKITKHFLRGTDPFVDFYLGKKNLILEQSKKWHIIFINILILLQEEVLKSLITKKSIYFTELYDIAINDKNAKTKIIRRIDILNDYLNRLEYYLNIDLFYSSLMIEK